MALLLYLATQPNVDFLMKRIDPGYESPDVPTGAIHPIWGILVSAALLAAVIFLSLMSSKRDLTE
jgi:hypothetical protein